MGLVSLKMHLTSQYTVFLPFFVFFVFSLSARTQLKLWKQEDDKIAEDIIGLQEKMNEIRLTIVSENNIDYLDNM
mgnify:CR=1 FL=1